MKKDKRSFIMSWTGNLDCESILNSTPKKTFWHIPGLCLIEFLHYSMYMYKESKLVPVL